MEITVYYPPHLISSCSGINNELIGVVVVVVITAEKRHFALKICK